MAPPLTKSEEIRYRAGIVLHSLMTPLAPTQELLIYAVRLGLFLLKLGILGGQCWPYVPGLEVGVPLIVVAALELGLPSMTAAAGARRGTGARSLVLRYLPPLGPGTSLALLALHFYVIWVARRWNTLCVSVPTDDWVDW